MLSNGSYAVMDRLAETQGEPRRGRASRRSPLDDRRGFGCPARRIEDHDELLAVLDEVVPGLAARTEPLVLDIAVEADPTFDP